MAFFRGFIVKFELLKDILFNIYLLNWLEKEKKRVFIVFD